MKKLLLTAALVVIITTAALAQFTFYLIDNFESGEFSEGAKWWRFGDLKVKLVKNPTIEGQDLIAESCGDYALAFTGGTRDWYIGGIGTELGVDASKYSRFQIDMFGHPTKRGKLVVEFFDDDNNNYTIEQDAKRNYEPIYDDKWVAEIKVQGDGYTRTSIPFSAFEDVNPGVGDDIWNPHKLDGSGGLLKMQIVMISEQQSDEIDLKIDNLLLTY